MTPPFLTAPLLDLPGVRHAFFTRQGGVSRGIYASLNVGRGSSDASPDVTENRRRAAAALGAPEAALSCAYQIHSADALVAERAWGDHRPEGDAVVTAVAGVLCGVLAADCAPVLLADPGARVAASAHAGWKGALGGIVASTVEAMVRLGAEPGRIHAAIGPCIGRDSYEVGEEFLARFETADPDHARYFSPGAAPDKRQFDLPAFVLGRLAAAGVARAAWIGHDTCVDEARFFSNRRAFRRGETDFGRMLSTIMIED